MKKTSFQTNFKPFPEHVPTYILYHCLCNLMQIPLLLNFELHYSESRDFEQNVKYGFHIELASEIDKYRLKTCCSS